MVDYKYNRMLPDVVLKVALYITLVNADKHSKSFGGCFSVTYFATFQKCSLALTLCTRRTNSFSGQANPISKRCPHLFATSHPKRWSVLSWILCCQIKPGLPVEQSLLGVTEDSITTNPGCQPAQSARGYARLEDDVWNLPNYNIYPPVRPHCSIIHQYIVHYLVHVTYGC